jgi:serine/threonine protein kinase
MTGPNTYVSQAPPTGISDVDWRSTESTEPDLKYAIFYDEGPGYLHVKDLGEGTQGRAILVHSVADGRLYVRKISSLKDVQADASRNFYAASKNLGQHHLEPRELSQYRPYPNIPGLIDFITLVHNPPLTKNRIVEQSVRYWQFCNGGDLDRYISQYVSLKESIPAIVIWRFLWQLFKTFEFLQHCQPPVSHTDIFESNIFVHWSETSKPNVEASTGDAVNTDRAAELDYYVTVPDQESGDLPDFYLGDFGHAKSTYRTSDVRRSSYLHDLDCIAQVFAKLILCTASRQELQMDTISIFQAKSYSADLANIWDEIFSLKALVKPTEPLDLKPLEEFIEILGRGYPKTYTNATVQFTRPASGARPALFNSKDLLLSRYGFMKGGPWYICTINTNNEISVMTEPYGLPGQSAPAAGPVLRVMTPDEGSPYDGPEIAVPIATAYFPSDGFSDPESGQLRRVFPHCRHTICCRDAPPPVKNSNPDAESAGNSVQTAL